ncbi:MAG: hypothetical protein M0P31_07165 [Solirubrobacteraceae bacterium]|nr:hypothetical protein [Solirubrobacteraceae bacterium]
MPRRTLRAALVAALMTLLTLVPSATAANSLVVGIADENVLQGLTPGGADETVAKWKAAGIDDVRIFAQWHRHAPDENATTVPAGFDGDAPSSYDFSSMDARIDLVRRHGLGVTLVVTGPGPVWASQEPARRNQRWKPNPTLFGEFSAAVAKHVADRVDRYIVWNEPNVQTWLQPQFLCSGRGLDARCSPYAPHLYRELAQAGYEAIHANDPKARVAIGATSSKGTQNPITENATTPPLRFLRELFCMSSKYKRTRSGRCRSFKRLSAEAYAYHPHSIDYSPNRRDKVEDNARMADLSRLTKALDRAKSTRGLRPRGASKIRLWLDEWAYETNPPDRQKDRVSPSRAALFSQWGWSVAARNPRVESLTQYEWFDEPIADEEATFNRWQSGLYFVDGKAKPLARVFEHPIFAYRNARRGYVWGHVRPATGKMTVTVERRKRGSSKYRRYKRVRTTSKGLFRLRVPRTADRYRYVYTHPASGAKVTSGVAKMRNAR